MTFEEVLIVGSVVQYSYLRILQAHGDYVRDRVTGECEHLKQDMSAFAQLSPSIWTRVFKGLGAEKYFSILASFLCISKTLLFALKVFIFGASFMISLYIVLK